MLWSLLTIATGAYAGLCLVFLVFQRSFIYVPTLVTPAHAQAFTLEEPVTRLVLITPFESIRAIAQRVAPFLPMRLLLRDPYESWRYASKVTCPTLVIAASRDEIVPLADTQRLVAVFPPNVATLRVFNGTDHNSVSSDLEFWEAMVDGS